MSVIRMFRSKSLERRCWSSLLLWIIGVSFLRAPSVGATTSSSSATAAASPKSRKKQQQQRQVVLQIYETEVYENDSWKGASPSRWSTAEGGDSAPPPSLQPPPGYDFEGDWKIVTSQNRDAMGWEYTAENRARRRTWLRTLVESSKAQPTSVAVAPKKTNAIKSLIQLLRQDWNFKGFGWSFYKSFLFRDSVGVSFRIPLTLNFDWWERHPGLPSITSAIGVYYPPTVALFLSASLNLDYLKWCGQRFFGMTKFVCRFLVVLIAQTVLLLLSPLWLVVYKGEPKYDLKSLRAAWLTLPTHAPTYNLEISERIGMSMSWRLSRSRGYEFRVSQWHSYLPTILHMQDLLLLPKFQKLPVDWLRQRTGSLGISTSGPTPDAPHFSCSACLSLSGYYYGKRRHDQQVNYKLKQDESILKETLASSGRAPRKIAEDTTSDEEDVETPEAIKVSR